MIDISPTMKKCIHNFNIHILLIVIITFSTFFGLFIPKGHVGSAEKITNFSINEYLKLPRFELNNSIYLYYGFAFLVVVVFYLLPKKWQWLWLLMASYFFLALWEIYFLIILIAVTVFVFYFGLKIDSFKKDEKKAKKNLLLGLLVCTAFIFSLKYFPRLFIEVKQTILIPLGLSYYVLQGISYLVDVYASKIEAEKHFGVFAVYMGFFPRLFVGPIERANQFISQIRGGIKFDNQNIADGTVRLFWGLLKKVVLVNRLVVVYRAVFLKSARLSPIELWIGVFLSGFYIYFDFSAFTDIAIGIGKMLGIESTENFYHPYLATSITDFWRRWHISLSQWLRDYIFTPLNFASRRANAIISQSFNIFVTFLISGIWHGNSAIYIFWGGVHGLLQSLEISFLQLKKRGFKRYGRKERNYHVINVLITYIIVNLTWVLFLSNSLENAVRIYKTLFSGGLTLSINFILLGLQKADFIMMIIFITFFMSLEILEELLKHNILIALQKQVLVIRWVIYLSFLFILIIFGYYGANFVKFDPIYMQF